ncbi:MAG: DUF5696 domain-containing protein [Clostridia bacterium]|nr:DUF5696 domain-containing protein [Clostridia bacterium]
MKKCNKILSLLLAAVMLLGCLTCMTVTASADEATTTAAEETKKEVNYLTDVFATPEDKLATMKLKLTKGDLQLYADSKSGEVAVKNAKTGQILSTNPYDVGCATSSDSIKYQLLSQIIVKYLDNGKEKEFSSYEYASMRDQIKVKNIKNGIRVEYIIGREEARHLLPRQIEDSRFREKILAPMLEAYNNDEENFYYKKFLAYYGGKNGVKSVETQATDSLKQDLIKAFPVTGKGMAIWVFDSSASTTEIEKMEELVKANCPEYSYEDMDEDHQMTEYESNETNPPVFKMALEYTLTEDGFTVRLPVNGLTYNESLYQVNNLSILPYMGCGNNAYDGYIFYPDGSGTLFSMQDLVDTNTTSVASKVYGVDFAYHQITGTYQQTVRYPIFGIVEDTQWYDCEKYNDSTGTSEITRISGLIYEKVQAPKKDPTLTLQTAYSSYDKLLNDSSEIVPVTESRGYTAIIEEGDALTSLVYYHSGVLSPYDTVMMNFNPKPSDSYNLADSISVGTNSEWTVTTERKYTGNFKVHYIMLTDEALAADLIEKGEMDKNSKWYDATWLGMAFAYRDYLIGKGILSPLTAEETNKDIPLYIETFGSLETIEKVASIPVTVKKALTSAADVITMYNELSEKGVTNINFRLTGFANGGMFSKMPYNLKWEKSVQKEKNEDGDKVDMQDLFDYAAKINAEGNGRMGLYPEFDFSYITESGAFDGVSMRKHTVRTIDDRKTSKREYSATQQSYQGYFQLAVSPAYFSHFYEKFLKNYAKYENATGLSVGSLGTDLNSDFDEDEPYNREDSRTFVQRALAYMSAEENGGLQLMVEGGNVYSWQYVKHILGMALDSSRYIRSSYSVPFVGVVLHGYMNFTGTPLNMEGDVNYAKLKAIENGAAMYFTLSYKNTELLKEDKLLSHYYSIRYDIWFDDVVEIYNEVNGILKDVQDKIIVDHEFLSGMRVPDVDELENDLDSEFERVLDYQTNKEEYELKQKSQAVADARKGIASLSDVASQFITTSIKKYSDISGAAYVYVTGSGSFEHRLAEYVQNDEAYNQILAKYEAASEDEKKDLEPLLTSAESQRKTAMNRVKTYVRSISRTIGELETEYNNIAKLLEDAENGKLLIEGTEGIPQTIIDEARVRLEEASEMMNRELGVDFNVTVDKAEVDTVLYAHIANLFSSCLGENGHSQVGIIGKAENLYKLISEKQYGLRADELDLLRYLDENKEKSDAELKTKYGLADGKPSIPALIQYVHELLGDSYTFDPVFSEKIGDNGMSEIDESILNYFLNMLYGEFENMADSELLPTLNFVPTRVNENKKTVSNTTNINNTIKDVNAIITDKLTGTKGAMKNVTDGNYTMSAVVTEDELKAIVDSAVKKIQSHFLAEGATDNSKTVEYATPDTLEADTREFIISSYYKAAVQNIKPASLVEKLGVMTISYTTDSTMTALANARLATYEAATFVDALEATKNDAELNAKLATLNDMLKDAYHGDVTDELTDAYMKAVSKQLLNQIDPPTINYKSKSKDKNAEIVAYCAEIAANTDLDSLYDLKDEVIEKINSLKEEEKDDFEVEEAEIKEYLACGYVTACSTADTRAFYYNDQMAGMDYETRAYVQQLHDQIAAKLPEGATWVEAYDEILKTIGAVDTASDAPDRSVASMTKDIASRVTYYIAKGSMSTDVQSYALYLLFKSFPEYAITETPVLPIIATEKTGEAKKTEDGELEPLPNTDSKYKNAINFFNKDYVQTRVEDLMNTAKNGTIRGEVIDYSLERLKTPDEMMTWAKDVYDRLNKGAYLVDEQLEDGAEKDKLLSAIDQYIRAYYYQAVMAKLSATKATTFHVNEIYGTDLYTASEQLKGLLRYFTVAKTEMTEKDIDDLTKVADIKEEEEILDPSKYLSSDGRIVAVTYGTATDSGSYEAYKTCLLNYNNFSVSVVYDEITYTIPAYGYVIIMH